MALSCQRKSASKEEQVGDLCHFDRVFLFFGWYTSVYHNEGAKSTLPRFLGILALETTPNPPSQALIVKKVSTPPPFRKNFLLPLKRSKEKKSRPLRTARK